MSLEKACVSKISLDILDVNRPDPEDAYAYDSTELVLGEIPDPTDVLMITGMCPKENCGNCPARNMSLLEDGMSCNTFIFQMVGEIISFDTLVKIPKNEGLNCGLNRKNIPVILAKCINLQANPNQGYYIRSLSDPFIKPRTDTDYISPSLNVNV